MAARTAWRIPLFAALALFMGWQAQTALTGPRPVDGALLYAAAMILYIVFLGGHSVSALCAAAPRPESLARRAGGFRVLVSLAILATAGALVAFGLRGHDDWGWTLHLASLLLLAGTAIRLPGPAGMKNAFSAQSLRSPGWTVSLPASFVREWLPLLLVLIFAVSVRIWHNDSIPPGLYYDEAREGVSARQILSDPTYRPVYIDYIERPAQHAYLVALSFALFGDSIASLRLVPALFGVLNVLAAYLFFNRWFGHRFQSAGLIAAALFAVTRYDLTFSRIVFDADSTPFFMMLTLFFLHRGFVGRREASSRPRGHDSGGEPQSHRREASSRPRGHKTFPPSRVDGDSEARAGERRADFVLAGLTLGIGQGFYLPMRIFAVLLVGLGLCLAVPRVRRERSFNFLRPWYPCLLLALLALLVAVAPIAEFALQSPGIFFDRNVNASIFYQRAEPNLLLSLLGSTLKHLGMFNFQGDQNARHNLPGAPMLDPLSGVLFLLGLGLALHRWRDPRNFVMLLLFAGMLQAGILSTDWEAPQALRSVGVLPSVIYFVTMALVVLIIPLSRLSLKLLARGPLSARAVPAGVLAAALLAIAWFNLDLYFNRQAHDILVWRAHSSAEVWTAGEMRRLAPAYDVILPSRYEASPTIKYLAPGIAPSRIFTTTDLLPLQPPPARPVALFIDANLRDRVDEVRRVYTAARILEYRPPDNSEPVVYEILLDY